MFENEVKLKSDSKFNHLKEVRVYNTLYLTYITNFCYSSRVFKHFKLYTYSTHSMFYLFFFSKHL